jgi:Fe/S biogenesis protein NfuA
MITITEKAKTKILSLLEDERAHGMGLRLAIAGRGVGGFRYSLGFVPEADKASGDLVVDMGEFKVFVDAASAPQLEGAQVDYFEDAFGSGFRIENPNPVWEDPVAQAVQEVLDTKINPGIASHRGFVTLLEVKQDTAFIQFGGGCQGCGMADVTLKQGVEVMIREAVPQIEKVLDTTDHAEGTNPYYRASGAGPSAIG